MVTAYVPQLKVTTYLWHAKHVMRTPPDESDDNDMSNRQMVEAKLSLLDLDLDSTQLGILVRELDARVCTIIRERGLMPAPNQPAQLVLRVMCVTDHAVPR